MNPAYLQAYRQAIADGIVKLAQEIYRGADSATTGPQMAQQFAHRRALISSGWNPDTGRMYQSTDLRPGPQQAVNAFRSAHPKAVTLPSGGAVSMPPAMLARMQAGAKKSVRPRPRIVSRGFSAPKAPGGAHAKMRSAAKARMGGSRLRRPGQ